MIITLIALSVIVIGFNLIPSAIQYARDRK